MNTAMMNMLSLLADISYGEKIINGLIVVVVGLAGVFAVLAIIWGVLALFKVFFYDIPEKKKAAKIKAAPAPTPVAEAPVEAAPEADDTQLIAVITAAIAAYTAENGSGALPFRVVSYKRVRGANGWNGADENETI